MRKRKLIRFFKYAGIALFAIGAVVTGCSNRKGGSKDTGSESASNGVRPEGTLSSAVQSENADDAAPTLVEIDSEREVGNPGEQEPRPVNRDVPRIPNAVYYGAPMSSRVSRLNLKKHYFKRSV